MDETTLFPGHGRLGLGSFRHLCSHYSCRVDAYGQFYHGRLNMKIFGISVMTIIIVLIAYVIGAKYPGPVNSIAAKL